MSDKGVEQAIESWWQRYLDEADRKLKEQYAGEWSIRRSDRPRAEMVESFRAGWSAALASLARYRAHLEEQGREAEGDNDVVRYRAFRLAWSEVRNVELWMREGVTCGIESHAGCRGVTKGC